MVNYDSLGVRRIINAYATVTIYGGSLMTQEVVQAMAEAATSFVGFAELHQKVGEYIADLTQNEAAYVTSGAAAGIVLSAAACVAIHDSDYVDRFPHIDDQKNEVIMYQSHRNGFDYGIRQLGLHIVEIEASRDALTHAITPNTSSIFWFQGPMTSDDDMPLSDVIEIANQHQIPVVVDAAAQLPPVDNLWSYTQMGASLVIFSGGKDLRGPQSTGLILGRRDLIEKIRVMSNPNHGVGRAMKVGKEEMMGVLAAVERYIKMDHDARAQYCETTVQMWCDALNVLDGVSAQRKFPNEAGQPLARCLVTIDIEKLGKTCDTLIQEFLDADPAIAVAPSNERQFYLNPMTLEAGEESIVLDSCLTLLS